MHASYARLLKGSVIASFTVSPSDQSVQATLEKHRQTLTETDIETLIEETATLKEIQDAPARGRRGRVFFLPLNGVSRVFGEKPDGWGKKPVAFWSGHKSQVQRLVACH